MKITAVCLALFIGTAAVAAPVAAQQEAVAEIANTVPQEAIQDCVICCIASNHHNNTSPRECVTRCRNDLPEALGILAEPPQ